MFRDFNKTKFLWSKLVHRTRWRKFFDQTTDFHEWIAWNITTRTLNGEDWKALFSIICWWLWRRRNMFVFEKKIVNNYAIIANSFTLLSSLRQTQKYLPGVSLSEISACRGKHGWQTPAQGWVKLNVDGAFSSISRSRACGGLPRKDTGQFILGFIQNLEDGDALHAELWACLHGLKLAWDGGHRRIILESDLSNAAELIATDPDEHHRDYCVIQEIREMLCRDWEVQLQHVSRECNRAADCFAKKGLSALRGFHLIASAPDDLLPILDLDRTLESDHVGIM